MFVSNRVGDVPHVESLVNSHGNTDEISVVEEGRGEF